MTEILTRRQAAERGLKRYYNGRPCGKGHDAPRFTSTGACVKCVAGYSKEYSVRLRKESTAHLAGFFSYPSHPDDHAAALAYCQALDMQRGRLPRQASTPAVASALSLDDIEQMRIRAFGPAGAL